MILLALALAGDILIADFEGEDYGDWKTTGTAFGEGPAQGTLPNQMAVTGYRGHGLVNSFNGGDASTGTLTSPTFKVQRKYITFLIGGGKDIEKTCVRLVVDGKTVRKATGPNDKPGGSEALSYSFWDVDDLSGKSAQIVVVDQATGGWGHVNLDHIVQTDKKPPVAVPLVKRSFAGKGRYLNLPIKDGAPLKRVRLMAGGKLVVANNIGLADGEPDWWAPMDLGDVAGPVTLEVDNALQNVLQPVTRTAKPKGMEGLYQEKLRAQYHFSPARGWTNDPNGMVYYKGEYHLFFQHNPYGWAWENMHWGHAVSKDMLHWTELPDALAPDSLGTIYSGSAVVDKDGTAGFGKGAQILIYTAAGEKFTQCLAYSTDGRHYTKYAGNPVLPEITNGNRDPKVMWYEPTKRWIMSLYVEEGGKHKIVFHSSPDLKKWTREGEVEGFFECPDLFPLMLNNALNGEQKWVLTAANSEYVVGSFDGHTFKPETPKLPGHRGQGFYAAQTFSDMPGEYHEYPFGRRVQIGWFQTESKGVPFNQSMSLPNELKLVSTLEGPRMTWTPVKELDSLRTELDVRRGLNESIDTDKVWGSDYPQEVEINLGLFPSAEAKVNVFVAGVIIAYDAKAGELQIDERKCKVGLKNGRLDLRIFRDRNGIEVYADGGLDYMPYPYAVGATQTTLSVIPAQGTVKVADLVVYGMKSTWPQPAQPGSKSKS